MIDTHRARLAAHPPYDHVLLDLDGCLWVGDDACAGAVEAVAALREAGKRSAVPHQRRPSRTRGLRAQAVAARLPGVAGGGGTVGAALQYQLSPAATAARRSSSARRRWSTTSPTPGCGSSTARRSPPAPTSSSSAAHDDFDYRRAAVATQAVLRGAELVGAARDATFPMPDGPWPGTGAVLAAVEAATGRTRRPIVGKPEPAMYEAARDRLGPGRVLAVGDRLDVDVAGARRAGLDSRARAHRRHVARRGRRRRSASPTPWPTRSPRSCSLTASSLPGSHGPRRPPDRQPVRRRRPRRRGCCPRSRPRCARTASRFRVDRTTSIEHARELARGPRATAGEVAAAMGGDGLAGAVAGELRGTDGVMARPARRPRQRLRAQARHRRTTPSRPSTCSPAGRERRDRRRRGRRRARSSGILSAGFDSDVQGDRQRDAAAARRRSSTSTARCARCGAGGPRAGTSTIDGAEHDVHAATPSRWRTRASSAAGCGSCPDAELDDGLLDVVLTGRPAQAALPARPAAGVQGHARRRAAGSSSCAAARSRSRADRPFTAYADGDPIADLPATVRVVPGALRVLAP